MILNLDYVAAWPEEVKQAQREYQRLYYKKINLENNLETADYASFDMLFDEYERIKDAFNVAAEKFRRLAHEYDMKDLNSRTGADK